VKKLILVIAAISALVGCNSKDEKQEEEKPETVAVTRWSNKTELFMEHPPLVTGEKARFAVHFTNLGNFKPLASGRVIVELRNGSSSEKFVTPGPSKPGIFGVDVQPSKTGTYTMIVSLDSADVKDSHDAGGVTVYGDARQAASAEPETSQEETLPFLKEQQWSLDFATAVVAEKPIRESIRVPAEIRPRTGGEAQITAPVSGRLSGNSTVPPVGTRVSKGQIIARIIPRTAMPADLASIESAVTEAKTELAIARKDRERAERLLAVRAVPEKRLDEARAAETTAEARLKSAQARFAQHEASRSSDGDGIGCSAFLLRSPISGVIAEAHATPGAGVEEGQSLFRIVAVDTVYVAASVPEAEAARLKHASSAEVEVPGIDRPLNVGKPISIGQVVDPATRTIAVLYQLENRNHAVAVGQSAFLRLFTSAAKLSPTVPESAVVDDAGRPVVFVQREGEAFARRPVKLGNLEDGFVQVLDGVKPGDRVVTRGAYLVRLSAMSSSIPAHGHVH
jgi:membrane fusion protein, heavy metal efflux system